MWCTPCERGGVRAVPRVRGRPYLSGRRLVYLFIYCRLEVDGGAILLEISAKWVKKASHNASKCGSSTSQVRLVLVKTLGGRYYAAHQSFVVHHAADVSMAAMGQCAMAGDATNIKKNRLVVDKLPSPIHCVCHISCWLLKISLPTSLEHLSTG